MSTIRTVSFSTRTMLAIEQAMPKDGNFSGFVNKCILFAVSDTQKLKLAEFNLAMETARKLARELFNKDVALVKD